MRTKQKKKMMTQRPYCVRNNSGDAGRLKDKKVGRPRESGWDRPAWPGRTDRPTRHRDQPWES
jgi:hypothetical protein